MGSRARGCEGRIAGPTLRVLSSTIAIAALLTFSLRAAAPAAAPSDLDAPFATVLTRDFGFTSGDLAELSRGRLVSRTPRTADPREIAVVAAVRVNTASTVLLERLRDITQFKQGKGVLQIGTFSTPPAAEDLASLRITPEDGNLRTCRVGDCDVRLSAEAIERLRRGVDWQAADADARAAALFKDILLEDVRAYVAGTPGRMQQYADGNDAIQPVSDFRALVENSPCLGALVPSLPAHLVQFPNAPVDRGEDFLYWSKEKFGLGPFITVTHVSIVPAGERAHVITSKDVYSSRYIDSSLGVTIASESAGSARQFYLLYSNRSRAHALSGLFSSMRRSIAEGRAKTALEQNLLTTKSRLEHGV